jgi:hypothetical protein
MKKIIYIYHHMGMGDTLLCNGLIRHFSEENDLVFIFSKPQYIKNTLYMYRDNPKIKVIQFDDYGVKSFMALNPQNNYLVLGHTPEYFKKLDVNKEWTFEEGFYKMANVPFEYKWSKFFFKRDMDIEKEAFNRVGLKEGEKYLFIHDDPKRGRIFKKEYIDKNIKTIHPTDYQDIGLFDFFYIMENAYQVHVHNSSFANLIDTIELKTNQLFYHKYARTDMGENGDQTFSKNINWTFLN